MKVLIVGPYLDDPGGVAWYYKAVLPRLVCKGVNLRYLEIGSSGRNGFLLHKIRDQFRFWRILHSFDPGIVQINPQLDLLSFVRDGLFILAARLTGKRVLVFYHGWRARFERHVSSTLLWFFRLTYLRCNSVIVLAQDFQRKLREWGIRVPIYVASTVVDDDHLDDFSIDVKCSQIERGTPLKLLFMSRLVEGKGLFQFLEGFRRLVADGLRVRATIAGDGPLMNELREYLSGCGELSEYVDVVGYVVGDEKARILREHHIFCLPTTYPEGLPTALVEALTFGMAVLTCPTGGIADVFEPERMGVLLETPDAQGIRDGLGSLAQDRSLLSTICRYNHEYGLDHFLASQAADFLTERYSEIHAQSSESANKQRT